ncbi:putative clathrin coat assembly protein [Trypanosoma grayi]|uniref:putative clathrin coat assembly protein n=1 Tax=Trypanosoma grayi TaxID=71804 RepID=UPI0004F3F1EA|nr:putative clathrin coat assembly protein [Trypanosoma grayi]KEG08445.1 putative clathrin coat assembly protein [Trypanosoma grayi]
MNEKDTNELKRGAGYLKEKAIIGLSRVTGDELDRAIMKVTSHMLKAPKEKHMQRLLAATYGHYKTDTRDGKNISNYIVSELEKRLHTHNWIVVLKSLVTLHRLMRDGSDEVNSYIQRNRNIFCAWNLKDLSEDVDGAAQGAFIRQYLRYLEERASSQEKIGIVNRLESVEFSSVLRSSDVDSLTPLFEALLTQLGALVEVEYREAIVDNFCTLEAYQKIIDDGKVLYQLLSDRVIFILDGFDDFSLHQKKVWLELYRQYSVFGERLRLLFDSILSSTKVFDRPPPRLRPLPPSLLEKLEGDVRLSSIPREDVTETLESLGIIRNEQDEAPLKETQIGDVAKQQPSPLPSDITEEDPTKESAPLPPTVSEKKEAAISMDDLFISVPVTVSAPVSNSAAPGETNVFQIDNPQQAMFTPQYDVNFGVPALGDNNNVANAMLDGGWSTGAPVSWETTSSEQYAVPAQTTMTPHTEWSAPASLANETTQGKSGEDAFKNLYAEGQKGWYSKDK